MAGFSTTTTDHLIRSQLWSMQLKEAFEEELNGVQYVDWLTEFTDGDTINIPSISTQAEVLDYVEGEAIRYTAMGTGNFTFSITEYKQSATYITQKMKQDSIYIDRLVSRFVPSQNRAIMKSMEVDVFALGPNAQTASNLNTINGANHRWVASGTNQSMALKDFALARYALQKANVPMTNLVAVVDPSVEYTLMTQANLVNLLTPQPQWATVINNGITTGTNFRFNIYGFDVYTCPNLKQGMVETINGNSAAVGVANLFFSAAPEALPFLGNVRQPPRVDSEFNKDLQRDEYVTTARYGFKLYRPENMVVVISDTDVVV